MPTPVKAIPCQGFTITWGSSALYSVQQLEADFQKGLPVGRGLPIVGTAVQGSFTVSGLWSSNPGVVRLIGFSAINIPASDYGKRRTLLVECPSDTSGNKLTVINRDCIYQDLNIQAKANDAVTFAYVFKVMDTVGAPTNP